MQDDLRELAATVALSDEQDQILTVAFLRCEELVGIRLARVVQTNRELAAKYGTSERTVRYWRREGCPFDKGQAHVLKWIAARRYAPAGTEAKFKRQLQRRRFKRSVSLAQQALAEAREVRWLHLQHGSQPPEWMQNMRARRGKVPFFDPVTCKPLETSLHFEGEKLAKPHG